VGHGLAAVVLTTLAINGIMRMWGQRAIFALGAWLLLSPCIIGFTATISLMWNSVIFGGLIFVFAGWSLARDVRRRRAGHSQCRRHLTMPDASILRSRKTLRAFICRRTQRRGAASLFGAPAVLYPCWAGSCPVRVE
jgi:hypothetical protein